MLYNWRALSSYAHNLLEEDRVRVKVRRPVWAKGRVMGKDLKLTLSRLWWGMAEDLKPKP
jgi:hypothetical protein